MRSNSGWYLCRLLADIKAIVGDIKNLVSEIDEGFAVSNFNYHMDDMSIPSHQAVGLYEVPTPEITNYLLDTYMDRIHPSFPVIGRLNLKRQVRYLFSGTVQRPPNKWLSVLNLIFAISAKYSHLANAEWKSDQGDHIIYFTRARLLAISSETIFEHPDLQTIQIMGLMSFYLLANGQVNR
jgi:hypothetical protein